MTAIPARRRFPPGLRTVPLFTGLTMLPVTDEVAARLDQTATGG
jgi:hypothetical protein